MIEFPKVETIEMGQRIAKEKFEALFRSALERGIPSDSPTKETRELVAYMHLWLNNPNWRGYTQLSLDAISAQWEEHGNFGARTQLSALFGQVFLYGWLTARAELEKNTLEGILGVGNEPN